MQVHVEDVLSCCGAVGEPEVDALATQLGRAQRGGGTLPDAKELRAVFRIELGQRACVLTGHDEQVPGSQRSDVEERQRPFVLVDDAGLELAGDDPAEDAVRCCHGLDYGRRWRRMISMNPILGFAHHTGTRLAEVGFLLVLFAGVWLAAAQMPVFKFAAARTIVAGLALALAGVLLIVAVHWGHFG